MKNKISEEEQRQLFISLWHDHNVQLVCEVPVFCRSVDLVKYNQKERAVTAVEFKTHNWKRAIEQVISTAVSFDYLEICVQKPKTQKVQEKIIKRCGELGVGIYFMESEKQQFTEAKESFLQAGERMTGRQSSGYATFYTDITRCCQLFLWMNMTHHCSKRIRRGIGMR